SRPSRLLRTLCAVGVVAALLALVGAPVANAATKNSTTNAAATAPVASTAPASLSGLAAGDYQLTVTVTAPTGTTVPGAVVEYVKGQAPLVRVATFRATSTGTAVTADVRVTGPTDVFVVMTNAPTTASA